MFTDCLIITIILYKYIIADDKDFKKCIKQLFGSNDLLLKKSDKIGMSEVHRSSYWSLE